MFFQWFPIAHVLRAQEAPCVLCSFTMKIYSGDVVSKDVLKSFRNLLQGGDGTSTKIEIFSNQKVAM